jgi:hypothetical protein
VRDDQGTIKIDQVLHNGHVSVSYGDYAQLTTSAGPFGPVLQGSIGDNHGHRAIANWDTTVSPTLLNHFNAAFTRWLLETLSGGQQTLTTGSNLNQLAGLAKGLVGGSGLAAISVSGGYFLGTGGSINDIVHQDWRLTDDLTWRHGSHQIQVGASMDRISTQGVQTSGGHTYRIWAVTALRQRRPASRACRVPVLRRPVLC